MTADDAPCLICGKPLTEGTWERVTLDHGERIGVHHRCHALVLDIIARQLADHGARR